MRDLRKLSSDVRKYIVTLSFKSKSAHVGSGLSCVEALVALFDLKYHTEGFKNSKIILSKGHAAMALYATAMAFKKLDLSIIDSYLKDGTYLWGHPSLNEKYEFIDWSTGSLGHGLPVGTGMALGKKIKKSEERVFVVVSDGELDEGSNWEAILFAGHHKLDNLVCIVDYNKIQSFGRCDEVINLEPLKDKWTSFGWNVVDIDGHNLDDLRAGVTATSVGRPTVVIAHTIKGKGLAEYEDTVESHYKSITQELYDKYGKINA